jgi:rhamnogalacturonan endolyase
MSPKHRFPVFAALRNAATVWLLSSCAVGAAESLDRGVVAFMQRNGTAYVGWRWLATDPADVTFDVLRSATGSSQAERITSVPVSDSCNFVDTSAGGRAWHYSVQPRTVGQTLAVAKPIQAPPVEERTACRRLKLQGDYRFDKVGIADLDGDGALDFVIKQPQQVTDPGVWKRSEDTLKVEAYKSDGAFLWRHDLGWNIEQGVWWSPLVVFDFDGDGKAEVALKTAPTNQDFRNEAGRVLDGPEYCSVLDGITGKELDRVDWPPRGNIADWGDAVGNRASRHLIGVAYLDGQRPSLIVLRGTYTLMLVDAYDLVDKRLTLRWRWSGDREAPKVRGQGLHGMHAADVDGDGRDEILLGAAVLDDDGKLLWNLGLGHPDAAYVADILPERPGLEIIYAFETRQVRNGFCLVEAKSGKLIWGCDHPTTHLHSQGLFADIDPANPGPEFYSGEKAAPDRWLYSARDGKLLSREELGSLAPTPVFWDDTPLKAYVNRGRLVKYHGPQLGEIKGRVVAVGDLLGDWREEIITSVPGELRIYTSTIPATSRRPCALQDRAYRTDVALEAMGYLYPPQPGGKLLPGTPAPKPR